MGLDQPIGGGGGDDGGDGGDGGGGAVSHAAADQHTRSMLYRAVTRAHMQVIVVNELLSGGWLEFLGNVRLRDDEKFSAQRAIDRCEVSAVEEIVTSEVDARLREGARAANAPPTRRPSRLRADVTRATETGVTLGAAVDDIVRGWGAEVEHVSRAIERAARDLGADLSAPVTATSPRPLAPTTTRAPVPAPGPTAAALPVTAAAAAAAVTAVRRGWLLDGMALTVALALRKGRRWLSSRPRRRCAATRRSSATRLDAEILAQHAASQAAAAEPSPLRSATTWRACARQRCGAARGARSRPRRRRRAPSGRRCSARCPRV